MVKWKEFQTRHPTIEEVTNWFDKCPDANIGIVTGEISNLVVFDLYEREPDKSDVLMWLQWTPGIAGAEGQSPALWQQFVITEP